MKSERKKIAIIGAGGFGREVFQWLNDLIKTGENIEIGCFYDIKHNCLEEFPWINAPVNSEKLLFENIDSYLYVCAVGNITLRKKIFDKIKVAGGKFYTLVHSSAKVADSCIIGEGTVLCPGVILTENVKIGNNVLLNLNVLCGHDTYIGNHSIICPGVNINGNVNIEENVFVGSSAVITPGVKIMNGCQVSAGSIVYKCPSGNSLLHGNPAKVVKAFDPDKSINHEN